MKYLDLTLPTAAENLACDEALLDWCEEEQGMETLRVWEAREYFVVLGYANKAEIEVNVKACRERRIPIFRRCSGGGAVLQGPGCLNYSLVMRTERADALQSISETNCFIMKRNAEAVSSLLGRPVPVQGYTDLALDNLKFSGNSQRRRRASILFHGSFLLDFDIGMIEELLLFPSKQPAYRQDRPHCEFLTTLKLPVHAIKTALQKQWEAFELLVNAPCSRIASL